MTSSHSVHRAARALQDSKPADARDPGVRASLHAARPVAAPAAPLEAAEPALQLTREQLQELTSSHSCLVLPFSNSQLPASSVTLDAPD